MVNFSGFPLFLVHCLGWQKKMTPGREREAELEVSKIHILARFWPPNFRSISQYPQGDTLVWNSGKIRQKLLLRFVGICPKINTPMKIQHGLAGKSIIWKMYFLVIFQLAGSSRVGHEELTRDFLTMKNQILTGKKTDSLEVLDGFFGRFEAHLTFSP